MNPRLRVGPLRQKRSCTAEDIGWLQAYIIGLLDAGAKPEDLIGIFERAYVTLRDKGQEPAADLILDGLDLLTGWCGPGSEVPTPQSA